MRIFLGIVTGVIAAAAAAVGVLVYGTRTNNKQIINVVTRLQRDVLNPAAMATAGTPGAPYAVVEHVGRTSGAAYETPVGLSKHDDAWFISLPYGDQTSWARNVVAAGEAVIRHDGERYRVDGVRMVPIAATPLLHEESRAIQIFGIRWALRMTPLGPVNDAASAEADEAADDAAGLNPAGTA